MKYLIVGLGNPGKKYEKTRHNIGFRLLDLLAAHYNLSFTEGKYGAHATHITPAHQVYLLKPNTYMNLSGKAVLHWVKKKGIPLENLLVLYDDIHLPLARIRIRPQGGAGGHNGIKSINASLGTTIYPRIRFGVGNHFPPGRQADFVLGNFSPEEEALLSTALEQAQEATHCFITEDLTKAMQTYN